MKIAQYPRAMVLAVLLAATSGFLRHSNLNASTVIDGASNPTAISDERAISLLFLSLLQSPSEAADRYPQRAAATLARMGLSIAEGQLLLVAAQNFKTYLATEEQSTKLLRGQGMSLQQSKQLQAQRDAAAQTIAATLMQQLGANSAAKITSYLTQQVKPHVRIVVP